MRFESAPLSLRGLGNLPFPTPNAFMSELTIERSPSLPPAIPNRPALTTGKRLFGLATRRERWGLSWKGWLVIGFLVIGMTGYLAYAAYPFLAVTHRINA